MICQIVPFELQKSLNVELLTDDRRARALITEAAVTGVCRHNGHYSNDLDRDNVSHLDALWRRGELSSVSQRSRSLIQQGIIVVCFIVWCTVFLIFCLLHNLVFTAIVLVSKITS